MKTASSTEIRSRARAIETVADDPLTAGFIFVAALQECGSGTAQRNTPAKT